MILRKDLTNTEYDPYFQHYLDLIPPDTQLLRSLEDSLQDSVSVVERASDKLNYRYAEDKWTIGQVILHNIDTERVFAYRALRWMRGDQTALEGFNQDIFAGSFDNHAFAKAELTQQLTTTRQATINLFTYATSAMMSRSGKASGKSMSVRTVPFLIAGHHKHHENVILSRYLKED